MSTVEDLAGWLTAVWDEEERLAKRSVGDVAIMDIDNYGHLTVPAHWVLARIAADRKILAHCVDMASRCSEDDWPDGGMEYAALSDQARYIVKLKAEAYQDRPGFRPEWLVERQGVEG